MNAEAAKKFKETVQSMPAKEILMAMVEGLKEPSCRISMGTYGDNIDGICYGCAATNTTARIAGIDLTPDNINQHKRGKELEDVEFVNRFEDAIDSLRSGFIGIYNAVARTNGFAQIKDDKRFYDMPVLNDNDYYLHLDKYIELANFQED